MPAVGAGTWTGKIAIEMQELRARQMSLAVRLFAGLRSREVMAAIEDAPLRIIDVCREIGDADDSAKKRHTHELVARVYLATKSGARPSC